MDNKDFDDIIKRKLEDFSAEGGESDWSDFKEIWDREGSIPEIQEDFDTSFDEKIKNNLENLRVPFNSEHWSELHAKLEQQAEVRRSIFVGKALELVLFIIVIVGALNIYPLKRGYYEFPQYAAQSDTNITDTESKEVVSANTEIKEEYTFSDVSTSYSLTKSSVSLIQQTTPQIPNNSSKIIYEENENLGRSTRPLRIENQSSTIRPNALNDRSVLSLKKLLLDVPQRNFVVLDDKEIENSYDPIIDMQQRSTMGIGVLVGPKINLVNSPFDPVYQVGENYTINTNFNAGAFISKKMGNAELYAGLAYSRSSYKPKRVNEEYGRSPNTTYVASLERISFQTISMPIGARIDLTKSKKSKLYAVAGLTPYVVAESDFEVLDRPLDQFSPAKPEVIDGGNLNENARLSKKDFTEGAFEGGALNENLYASASIGLGYEHKISDKAGLFIEPKYNHFITKSGIGPNNDKVHSVSIDLGFKYNLN